MHSPRSQNESNYRKSLRWLLVMVVLFLPVGLLASKLSEVFRSGLIFGITLTAFMIAFFLVSTWTCISYWRWTGKYPFYWLRRK